ncbi:MAG: hypothetical protein KC433_08430 [Anaerolineales bacterium]|nr:hypothetical protein [Anaerolineales bacterium]MCB8937259.1 hypothetical protein [Ardenticatenaceae bacterium]
MEIQDPRIRSLLRQANKVADAGKKAAAEQLYRQLLAEAPDVAEAWYGLGRMLNEPAEQANAYTKSVSLKPDYAPAVRALAELRGEPVPAWAIEPEEPEEEPEPEPEPEVETAVPPDDQAYELACYRHSNRSTSLRCYNCGKPICSSCAIKTPVGYSCPDCIREKEDVFFNIKPLDYLVAPAIGLVLSLVIGYLVVRFMTGLGWLTIIGAIFGGGLAGRFVGQLTKGAIGRRRGRYLPHVMVVMLVLGTAVWLLPILIFNGFASLFAFIGPGIFLFVAGGALFSYMK